MVLECLCQTSHVYAKSARFALEQFGKKTGRYHTPDRRQEADSSTWRQSQGIVHQMSGTASGETGTGDVVAVTPKWTSAAVDITGCA
jgi:hypothetical protein